MNDHFSIQDALTLFLKRIRLHSLYYVKNIKINVSILFFVITTCLFLFICSPKILSDFMNSDIFVNRPTELIIEGTIYTTSQDGEIVETIGVTIESGGYITTSNCDGYFYLKFSCVNKTDVPVIFKHNNIEVIRRYDFSKNKNLYKKVVLRGE